MKTRRARVFYACHKRRGEIKAHVNKKACRFGQAKKRSTLNAL
jgi:hypothetical protein